MALNDIIFIKGQGGLGRPLPGQDFISGLVCYGSLPSGFTSSTRIKKFFSVSDAEAAGIKGDYSDSTAATASYLVTTIGTNGDTVDFSVAELNGATVDLGIYKKVSADSTATLVATAIAAKINGGTLTHGYSATSDTATVTIIAPKRLGLFLNNGTPITITLSSGATHAGTLTQFSGGTGSKLAVIRYHISEFFRIQPKGILYVGIFAVPGSYTFSEVTTTQNFSNGTIRQIGVFKDSAAFSTADLTSIQTVCTALESAHKPLSVLYGADLSGTTDISTLTDLSLLSNKNVSAIISQDGGALGATLYQTFGKSITTLGAALGAVALAKVSDDIAWVGKFNISNGTECDTLAFANGKLMSDSSITDGLLSTLNSYRYIFLRKFPIAGSYFNDSHTAIAVTSDYAYIENNRTIDKAIRGVYTDLLPDLNSPIQLKKDGTLSEVSVAFFESEAGKSLAQMVRDSELSDFGIAIDPTQNVASTSNLVVAIKLVTIGVARNIIVKIGFALSI